MGSQVSMPWFTGHLPQAVRRRRKPQCAAFPGGGTGTLFILKLTEALGTDEYGNHNTAANAKTIEADAAAQRRTVTDGNENLIDEDDDGENYDSYLSVNLEPGDYYIKVTTLDGNPPEGTVIDHIYKIGIIAFYVYYSGTKLTMRLTFQQSFYLGYQLLFVGNIINIAGGKYGIFKTAKGEFGHYIMFVGAENNADWLLVVFIIYFRGIII
jgi:hypothetical protein